MARKRFAKFMLLVLLIQNGLAAAAFASPAAFAEQMQAGTAHECASVAEADAGSHQLPPNAHHMLESEHEECVSAGCLDCVGSSPCVLSATMPEPHTMSASRVHWAAPHDPVPDSDHLYRPPIS
jgi:hypothetical protein